jgi:hypothetical protein
MTHRIFAVAAVVGCLVMSAGAVQAQTNGEAPGRPVLLSGVAGVYALADDTDSAVRFYGVGASWPVGEATWLGFEVDLVRVARDRTHIVLPGGDRTSYDMQPIVFFGATFMRPSGRVRPMGRLMLGSGGPEGVARAATLGVDVRLVGSAGLRLESRAYQGLFHNPFSTTVVGFAASFVWAVRSTH